MKKQCHIRIFTIAIAIVMLTSLYGCCKTEPETIEFNGQWKQVDDSGIEYHGAIIEDGQSILMNS